MADIAEDWRDPKQTTLDFIIVGAGAGGAPFAARLVERGYTVLIVEMGPEKPPRAAGAAVDDTEVPLLHASSTEDPRHSLRFFVKHFDEDPAGSLDEKIHRPDNGRRDETGIFYPRAQGIGGCTIHNAMITIAGPSEDWDQIAEATEDDSWRGESMRSYFERLERCNYARPSLWDRFKKLFGFRTGWEDSRHGFNGWLQTSLADLRLVTRDRNLLKVVLDGALTALTGGVERLGSLLWSAITGRIFPSLDPNNWEKMRKNEEGFARIPCAITKEGTRSDARARLLALKKEPGSATDKRLHLLTGAFVTKVVLEKAPEKIIIGGKEAELLATGIQCILGEHLYEADPNAAVRPDEGDWQKNLFNLYCRREVILCGGTFNTPQLLMLSGIGPKDHLEQPHLNIDVRVDLPGVGQNLQDRYEVPLTATVADRFRSIDGLKLSACDPDRYLQNWIKGKSAEKRGLYATNGGLVTIIVRSSEEDNSPDLFIFALAGYFPGYHVGYSKPDAQNRPLPGDPPYYRRALTWLILKARTRHHQGYVRLQSRHPFQRPEINFRSFPQAPDASLEPVGGEFPASMDLDLEALHFGVEFVQNILKIGKEHGTLADFEMPGFGKFNDNIRKWIKHIAWGHHACGTCRIGGAHDPGAVVDSRFRVRGVQGLRIVDASIFPRIPGFFIVTNVYMISEKAADVVAEDHPIKPMDLPPDAADALRRDPVMPSSPVSVARQLYPASMEEAEAILIAERRRAAGL